MPRCTRKGCLKEYDEDHNPEGSCSYHPGGPVFHEGLKSWSCCSEVNKPVLEFDQFMAIPPCTNGRHTTEKPQDSAAPTSSSTTETSAPTTTVNGVETYGNAPVSKPGTSSQTDSSTTALSVDPPQLRAPTPKEAEEDDELLPVPEGAICKRLGCGAKWEGEEVSRGSGERAVCRYHPQAPVFHEGSKGYLCCKRRVLEFSEFLKIEGCTTGKHVFVGAKKDETKEELVDCRVDHYQTPLQVHVSVFAKGADKEKSRVSFDPQQIHLDLFLPGNKRVTKTLVLYGPIDPSASIYRILSTKVDITLQKSSPSSWPVLELPPAGSELPPGYALTFGVTGRTGTVGGKEIVLAPEEMAKRQ